ncbi:putative methyltransferase [Actinoplanes missouriensis 431]|uniref:Putative methyltransferase n=1 Tax=Actinoplanes missouriensis (strain ATCC 14538 / DSM 43046 / CBS 188.64 / JCM 3121 / NBRC 102363 / NCIMB 12654 / NRRL B-3342 / UNCC 431) TaxID=512565 RepID=I0H121_ACTM4|nr:class I SAM-dependent methyltransferase [Actinoplanes missouriensis]BAL86708.1 putative methyltransferase [Actinoplanes missouriensis 431]
MWHGEYRHPRLVEVYDAECPWGWDDDFFMAVLAEHTAPRVLDLGCGTGRLAIAMAGAGHEVTGVDPAGSALDAARRKPGAARVRWVEGSASALPARAFDAAFLAGHVAQFFVDDQEWSELLRALRRSLVAEGRLIFDSRDPAARVWLQWNPEESRRIVVLADGGEVEAWTEVTAEGDGVVSLLHHYRFSDGEALTSRETLRFRTEEELRESLAEAGFRVDRVYGGWGREPVGLSGDGELIVIAIADS